MWASDLYYLEKMRYDAIDGCNMSFAMDTQYNHGNDLKKHTSIPMKEKQSYRCLSPIEYPYSRHGLCSIGGEWQLITSFSNSPTQKHEYIHVILFSQVGS
jgi:hypothetical protein